MSVKRSPELRPNGWDVLVALAVAALAFGSALAVWSGGEAADLTAVVTVDGREADRFTPADLLESPRTYTNNGYTVEVVYGLRGELSTPDRRASSGEAGLRVAWADCPTQDCVRTGLISRSGQSIVCLPARVIICLEGGGADGGVDAVTG